MLTCLLCLVSIGLFVIYRVISAALRGSCLLVSACMSFAFCQMINKEMLCFALLCERSKSKNNEISSVALAVSASECD